MDFESKPNDGYEEDEPYSNLTRKSGNEVTKRLLLRYILIAVLVLALVFLFILIFHRGPNPPAKTSAAPDSSRLTQMSAHLQDLDKRVTELEKQIAGLSAIEGASASNARGVEALSEKVQKIESRIDKVAEESRKTVKTGRTVEKKPRFRSEAVSRHVKHVTKERRRNAGGTEYHVVRKGETLYHLSRVYDVSLQRLMALNHIKDVRMIRPGQRLIIRKSE